MQIIHEYSHLGGSEILQVRYPEIDREISDVITLIKPHRTKVSKEKTSMDRLLFSPVDINLQFKRHFNEVGYQEQREQFDIMLPYCPETIIKGFKQIDFVKGQVLVEVQLGKYAFMFYDMAKFQYFFNESKAEVGVEIVPCHALHKQMSTGVSYGEQLINDIERLKRHFPAVPVKIILIDA